MDRQTGQPVNTQINLYSVEDAPGEMPAENYTMLSSAGEPLGWMQLVMPPGSDKMHLGWLDALKGKERYKGIGTAFIQAAIERSLQEGYGGQICLASFADAVGFYYKNGFRFADEDFKTFIEQENRQLADYLAQPESGNLPPYRYQGGKLANMMLPDSAIAEWKRNIVAAPILKMRGISLLG